MVDGFKELYERPSAWKTRQARFWQSLPRRIRLRKNSSRKEDRRPAEALTPARLLVQTDSQGGLRNDLVREKRIRWMNSTETGIADESFVTQGTEDS